MQDYEIEEHYNTLKFKLNQLRFEILTGTTQAYKDVVTKVKAITNEADDLLIGCEEYKTAIFDELMKILFYAHKIMPV